MTGAGRDSRAGSPALVQLLSVTKRYGALTAVEDVTVALGAGEVVGLIGANGAGKSTLMRLLVGAEQPDDGRILIDGAEVRFASPRAGIEAGFARVPQELGLVADQSVAENLLLGGLPSRAGVLRRRELAAQAQNLLSRVGLEIDPRREAGELTPVEQRLVAIAQALAKQPRLLVLDEPSAALPTETAARLQPLVADLAAAGTAVVYVSHRLDEIKAMCSRVVAMRDGRIAGTLHGDEIDVGRMVVLVGGSALEEEPAPQERSHDEGEPVIGARALSGTRVSAIDFEVHRGELLGVGGLYGSGRSELLRLLAGVQRPSSGTVDVLGAPGPRSSREAARRGVGYLAEGRGEMLFGDLSTAANASIAVLGDVSWGRTIVSHRRERSLVGGIAERVSLKGDLGARVSTLSGGNQQKVCLARWLLRGCDVLLLDEPTVGIDVRARAEIHRLLRQLAAQGTTVVVASAEPEELALLCDRVVVLVEGRLARELRSPFTADAVVAASYAGEAREVGAAG